MKKITALLLVCALAAGTTVSCGDSEGSGKSSSSAAALYDGNDDDDVYNPLVGMWQDTDGSFDGGGYIFCADNKLSMFYDLSEDICCRDGVFYIGDEVVEDEYIDFDGSTLKVSMEGYDILSMKRNGPKDSSSYYGEYRMLEDCMFYESFAESMTDEVNGEFNGELGVEFLNGGTYCYIPGVFEYEIIDGTQLKMIDVNGYGTGKKGAELVSDFVLNGDKLTIKDEDGDTVLKRIEK